MKHTIKRQLIGIFAGILAFILILIYVLNTCFLEQYYVSDKQNEMTLVFSKAQDLVTNDLLNNEENTDELISICQTENISITIMNDSGEILFYTEQKQRGPVYSHMFGYLVGENEGTILKKSDDYTIYRSDDFEGQGRSLDMYGHMDDGTIIFIQTPLESITDSARLATKFFLYVGFAAMILGCIFIWIFSRRITEPILELADISKRMADQDFNAKYSGKQKNEIAILGENFNRMSEKLETTITELKNSNNQLRADIEAKEKLEQQRTDLLGNVSHELKTPIALIQGYAEGLKEGVNDDPESRDFYCEVIMDEADKMNKLVKNLLMLNQMELGANEISIERFDLVGLIQGILTSCDILIKQAEASIDLVTDPEVFVWSDEYKIEQVFRNYLTNAIHHLNEKKKIEIRVERLEETVRVSVFNTGNPIPDEDIHKIWDKFYKVDKAHTREYGGNGIGLSIVKATMEALHQKYGVENYENGVSFWFEVDAKA